jgi:ubiquinone/menaquinone biosynthesis C-methylase UbiE
MGLYSNYVFPLLLDWLLDSPEFGKYRRRALKSASGEVLEIGFGTGLNLPYYPPAVKSLVVIDSERPLPGRVQRRIEARRLPVEVKRVDAQRPLPFNDNSFDTVVTTFTLCSIEDAGAALTEMRRVLKPEGQYLFFEHGRSDDEGIARLQDRLTSMQRVIACGCNLNRPIDRLIRESGFELETLDRFLLPKTLRILADIYRGSARVPR